ncbi:MAG TPA: hypothetical protein VIQ29_22405 [Ancylobacter sp.]
MTKFATTAILSAFISLATVVGASAADGRDTSATTVQAPVVEGRNAAVVVNSPVAANADRAISQAVSQVRR